MVIRRRYVVHEQQFPGISFHCSVRVGTRLETLLMLCNGFSSILPLFSSLFPTLKFHDPTNSTTKVLTRYSLL